MADAVVTLSPLYCCSLISCYSSTSVEFRATCDGHSVSKKDVKEAFMALSPEKLKSLFPIEVENTNKKEEKEVCQILKFSFLLQPRYDLFCAVIH